MNRQLLYIEFIKFVKARGKIIIPITGNSMLPTLKNGDSIIITTDYTDINIGDIVFSSVYANHGVVHRIYNIYNLNNHILYQTKGDNNRSPDPYYLYREAIIGKMVE